MANPIETLRKLKGRSLNEIRVRGEQAISVRTEQIGLSGKLPGNEEFNSLIDKSRLDEENITPETLRAAFYKQSQTSFFQSFADKEKTLDAFRRNFGGIVTASILDKAERITESRFDLLGYQNLDFGGEHIDWHYEPIARKRVALKHWKQFDELSTEETGDKKIIWELNRHQYFFTLGQAYWLTGDERYAETFARHLDEWIMQNPPGMGINWVSSLEVAFRAISWIWA
ncbi:MAG: heparinase II/III family protein, partial [Pyrinomonadaceae bacterium]